MSIVKTDSIRIFLLVAVAFVVYSNTLTSGFVWDDTTLIVHNPRIRYLRFIPLHFTRPFFDAPSRQAERTGPRYWRPVVLSSFNIDYLLWGDDPFGYHLSNLLIHTLNVLLVFFLLRHFPAVRPSAFPAALLFGIHPLQTNAVSYISGRTDLLACTFFLASGLFFMRCITRRESGAGSPVAIAFFLALSLLSKESTLTAPFLFLLMAGFTDHPSGPRVRRATAVAVGALIAYMVARFLVLGSPLKAKAPATPLSIPRLLAVAESLVLYVRLFLLPLGLHMERFLSLPAPTDLFALSCLCLVVLAVLAACRSLAAGRIQGALILWFFIALFPASNLIPLYPAIASKQIFVGEQFLYRPLIGLAAVSSLIVTTAAARIGKPSILIRTAAAASLALFGVLAYSHNEYWKDEETFYARTLRNYPGSVRMCTNLGLLYVRQKRFGEALRLLSLVAAQNPRSARAHLNLGIAQRKAGALREAQRELEKAIELNPRLAAAYNELGLVNTAEGRLNDALSNYEKAVEVSPHYLVARSNIALVQMKAGRMDKAAETLRAALIIDPRSPQLRTLLGTVYERQGRLDDAADQYRETLRYNPDFEIAAEKLKRLGR